MIDQKKTGGSRLLYGKSLGKEQAQNEACDKCRRNKGTYTLTLENQCVMV